MKKTLATLLFVIASAAPVFGRVISYAPYSDQPSEAGVHLRTSRWFVLLEGADPDYRKVVLYDSRGEEEPRVVYTANNEQLWSAAVRESAGGPPAIFVLGEYSSAISADGGLTWKDVFISSEARPKFGIDTGGPFTGGLRNDVRIGNDSVPFVVATYVDNDYSDGVFSIDAEGEARQLPTWGSIIGQDRTGTYFLVESEWGGRIDLVDVWGNRWMRFVGDPYARFHTGWVSSRREVFIESRRYDGRHLYRYRQDRLEFIAGANGLGDPGVPSVEHEDLRFLAVPTADFRGAWMIQRAPGQPTTLRRYTPESGVETMWSDPSGPEVEALIAGESGQSLLVQVHVPRDVNVAVPFIDPALAVWHVGEPYPAEYDELFLNEEPNKGFVHVDVDALEAGEPFVFNSGSEYVEPGPGEGPISPPIGGGGEVIQEWGVVRGSLKQRLVLPGVARMLGAFGSEWTTDVTIYNPLDQPQDVEVHFVSLNPAVQTIARRTQTVRVAPRRITVIKDALHSLFMIANGGGSLVFEPAIGVNVFGHTYTRSGNGTYGYGIQAVDYFNAAGPRFPLVFSGAFPGPNFRTNIVLTDTSGHGSAANLGAYGATGRVSVTTTPVATPVGGVLQLSTSLAGASGLLLSPTRGTIIPAVVAIDNITNDATYFPPDIPATVPRSIPMIAHTDEGAESVRSDLYLFNPTGVHRSVRLEAKLWDKSLRLIRSVTLKPFEARVIPDVMTNLFDGIFGIARLRYLSSSGEDGAGVRVTSRTYRTTATGGTYGSLVPPLNNFQIAAPGDTLEILGISGGDAFRTNLSLIELSETNSNRNPKVRVRIYDQNLQELGSFETSVQSTFTTSFKDLFALQGLETPRAAMIKVEMLSPGLIAAYTTLEDVATGDTMYLPANLGAKVR
jgi:hypothetical protein